MENDDTFGEPIFISSEPKSKKSKKPKIPDAEIKNSDSSINKSQELNLTPKTAATIKSTSPVKVKIFHKVFSSRDYI